MNITLDFDFFLVQCFKDLDSLWTEFLQTTSPEELDEMTFEQYAKEIWVELPETI